MSKSNLFIKSLQKVLNADKISSNAYDYLDNWIINRECCIVDNGDVTSCQCIANIDEDLDVRYELLEAVIKFNGYNTTNMKLYLQDIVL